MGLGFGLAAVPEDLGRGGDGATGMAGAGFSGVVDFDSALGKLGSGSSSGTEGPEL